MDGQHVLAIDRSGLRSVPEHEHGGERQPHKGPETPLTAPPEGAHPGAVSHAA